MEAVSPASREALTDAQRLIWVSGGLDCGRSSCGLTHVLEIQGGLDVPLMRECLSCLHRRHPALRARFVEQRGEPWRLIDPEAQLDFSLIRVTAAEVPSIVVAEGCRSFDLAAGPTFVARVLEVSGTRHFLLLNAHSLVIDRRSYYLLFRELEALYRSGLRAACCDGACPNALCAAAALAERPGSSEAAHRFWRELLTEAPALLSFPTDFPRSMQPAARFETVPFTVSWATSRTIRALCDRHGVTPVEFFLSALQVLLYRYSGQGDVVIGLPVRAAAVAGTEPAIGNYTQHLPLRQRLSPGTGFTDLLERNAASLQEIAMHRDYPFTEIVRARAQVSSHAPIFQHLFTYLEERQGLDLPALDVVAFPGPQPVGLLDTTCTVYDSSAGFRGLIHFNAGLFETSSARRWADNLIVLLEGICNEPDRAIAALPLLHPSETAYIAECLDKSRIPFDPPHPSLAAAFERQASRTPGSVAVRCGADCVSYADLNSRANAVARYLEGHGVEAGTLVGTCISRTTDMIAGILAVLKLGAAYVPLDPKDSAARLRAIAVRAGLRVALFDHASRELVELPGVLPLIASDAPISSSMRQAHRCDTQSLSHVVFAPTAMGTLAGVMVRHRNVLALLEWARATYLADDLKVVLCSTPLNRDPAQIEIWAPLTTGGSVALVDESTEPADMEQSGVTLVNATPDELRRMLDKAAIPSSVRVINICGGGADAGLISALFQCRPDIVAYNTYGQAEGTGYSTFCRITGPCSTAPPIGVPLPYEYSRVIDPNGNLVPLGAIGELCVGGEGVAAGYLNDPDRTASRFRHSRNYAGKPMREYRTGDLVRLCEDGKLHLVRRYEFRVQDLVTT